MALRSAFLLSMLLSVLKLAAYVNSSSVIVLASFFDSLTDSIVSYLNYFVFAKARENPDAEHPFGHGGFEVISSLLQGVLIATLALLLGYQTLMTLLWGGQRHTELDQLPFSIGVMAFSAFAGLGIQLMLSRYEEKLKARNEASLTVSADRAHYLGDFWTNGLGALGLLTVWYLRNELWDQILGLCGAAMLLSTALPLIRSSLAHIMQSGAEPELIHQLKALIRDTDTRILGVHRLRTRRHGPTLFIDFHLKLEASLSLQAAHEIGEAATAAIVSLYPRADVLVHLDPDNFPDESGY